MYATYPIYYPSSQWAQAHGEIDLWRESFKINKECKKYINENASTFYHDHRLDGFIKELTDTFGLERSMYVIARTIVNADWDGRYYKDAKERAAIFDFHDMVDAEYLYENGQDPHRTSDRSRSLLSNVHPVMLNAIFRSLMKMEREQVNLPNTEQSPENEQDEGVEY